MLLFSDIYSIIVKDYIYIEINYSLSRRLKSPTAQLCAMGRYKSTAPMSHSSTVNNFSSPRGFSGKLQFIALNFRLPKGFPLRGSCHEVTDEV